MTKDLQRISIEQWLDLLKGSNYPRYFQPDFIEVFASAYQLQYDIFQRGSIATVVFHKGRNARMESHFFDQIIWQEPIATHQVLSEDANALLIGLKEHFDAIDLKLPATWTDSKLLQEAGYKTKAYQTIVVPLHRPLRFSENIRRMLKKAEAEGYQADELHNPEGEVEAHIADMLKNGIPNKHQQALRYWISYCQKIGYLKVFALYNAERVIMGSALILDDRQHQTAYLLSIKSDLGIGQSPLYARCIEHFQTQKYRIFDLWGGNIPSIATFKLKWDSEKLPYYIAHYRKYPVFDQVAVVLKNTIKFFLKHLDFSTKGR